MKALEAGGWTATAMQKILGPQIEARGGRGGFEDAAGALRQRDDPLAARPDALPLLPLGLTVVPLDELIRRALGVVF